jgi:hypothetical protein
MRRNEITRMRQKQLPNIGEHDLTSKKLSADEYTSTSISSSPVAIGSGASLTSLSWDGWTHSFTTYALMVRTWRSCDDEVQGIKIRACLNSRPTGATDLSATQSTNGSSCGKTWGAEKYADASAYNVFYMLVIKWSIGLPVKDALPSASCKPEPFPTLIDGE